MALAQEFAELVNEQASDWSDLRFELHLEDELRFDEARLIMTPAQMQRKAGERNQFVFRVSHSFGYGAHAPLAQSCLEKLDNARIDGDIHLVEALHRVDSNWTQGPWMPAT